MFFTMKIKGDSCKLSVNQSNDYITAMVMKIYGMALEKWLNNAVKKTRDIIFLNHSRMEMKYVWNYLRCFNRLIVVIVAICYIHHQHHHHHRSPSLLIRCPLSVTINDPHFMPDWLLPDPDNSKWPRHEFLTSRCRDIVIVGHFIAAKFPWFIMFHISETWPILDIPCMFASVAGFKANVSIKSAGRVTAQPVL